MSGPPASPGHFPLVPFQSFRLLLTVHPGLRCGADGAQMHKIPLFSNFASKGNRLPVDPCAVSSVSIPPKSAFQEQRCTKESHPARLSPTVTHTATVSRSLKHILLSALQLALQSTSQISTSAMFAPQKTSDWDLFPFQQVDVVFHFPLTLRERRRVGREEGGADEETARSKIGVKQ